MTEFHPSGLSKKNGSEHYGNPAALISAGIQVVGGITQTAIGVSSSKKGQQRQIAHEEKMARKQQELAELQMQAEAGTVGEQAAAMTALEGLKAKKTMVLAAFGLAGLAIVGLTVVLASRSGPSYEDEEDYE